MMAQPVLLASFNQNRSRETECVKLRGEGNEQNGRQSGRRLCNDSWAASGLSVSAPSRELDPVQVSAVHLLLLLEREYLKSVSAKRLPFGKLSLEPLAHWRIGQRHKKNAALHLDHTDRRVRLKAVPIPEGLRDGDLAPGFNHKWFKHCKRLRWFISRLFYHVLVKIQRAMTARASCALRAGARRDALVLRILGRRRLHQRPHQRLIRCNPVGEHRPLLAIPLLELHAPAPLMIATGQGDRREQPLRPQLLERRGGEGEV